MPSPAVGETIDRVRSERWLFLRLGSSHEPGNATQTAVRRARARRAARVQETMQSLACSSPRGLGPWSRVVRGQHCASREREPREIDVVHLCSQRCSGRASRHARILRTAQNMLANPGFEDPRPAAIPGLRSPGTSAGLRAMPGPPYFTVGTNPAAWRRTACSTTAGLDHATGHGSMLILDGDTHRVALVPRPEAQPPAQRHLPLPLLGPDRALYNDQPGRPARELRGPSRTGGISPRPGPRSSVQIAGCTWHRLAPDSARTTRSELLGRRPAPGHDDRRRQHHVRNPGRGLRPLDDQPGVQKRSAGAPR